MSRRLFVQGSDSVLGFMFFKNSTLACIDAQSPGLVQCIAPYFARLRATGDPTRTVANMLINKECSTFSSASRCIVNQLQQCSDPTAADIVSGSFNETLRISPCAGYVEVVPVQPSHSSSLMLQQLQEVHRQKMTMMEKLESTLGRLESLQTGGSKQQDKGQKKVMDALEQQTTALERVSASLDSIALMLKQGRSKKW